MDDAAHAAFTDTTLARFVEYGRALTYEALPAEVVHECKRRVIDTLGCALGAYHDEPCRIARSLALASRTAAGARLLGTSQWVPPDLAAFANGVMGRYLDGNDTYPGGGGHPSDMMSAVFAVADYAHASGAQAIAALTLGYEVYYNFFQSTRMRGKGMDNVFYTAVGGAAAAAKLLKLDRAGMRNALALAITPNIALEATRRGQLSMWKGAAAGNASRNGVFAALLAAQGMTGPEKPIEDKCGLNGLVGEFKLAPFGGAGAPYRITHSSMKFFLSEYHSQSPITTVLELCPRVNVDAIESVTIYTQWFTWFEIGSEPEKWHPTTRETADHSLPWIIAGVLIDGAFSDALFSDERLRDERIHRMTDKIVVKEEPEFTRRFPNAVDCRIEIVTKSGECHVAAVEYPRGHHNNPMTDAEVETKFRELTQRVLPKARTEKALALAWDFENAPNLDELLQTVQIEGAAARE